MQRSVRRAAGLAGGIDPWLTLTFLGLICFGILMVYSSSIADAYASYGSPYFFLERELIWAGIGFIALVLAVRTNYHQWERLALPFFGLAVGLLVLVMIPHVGHVSNGARRWLSFGSFATLEPSELLKLALVVYLAAWLTSKGERVRDFKACFVPFSMMVGTIALVIIKQPDLGTSMVVAVTALAVFFVAGADLAQLGAACLGASGFAWLLMHSAGYRHDRLAAFLDPWHDPTGVGYHAIQALLALRYGGLFGQGLGDSIQKYVLPAPHTDSILAVIGEEWGLVGTLAVLLLFLVVAYRGMRIASAAPDGFGRLLAVGITSWITFQALLNFAVITSSVPFTGVPLPFISYGGTSLVISMAAIGILLNISRHASGEGFAHQDVDHRRGNRGTRIPRAVRHPVPAGVSGPALRSQRSEPRVTRLGARNRGGDAPAPDPGVKQPAIR